LQPERGTQKSFRAQSVKKYQLKEIQPPEQLRMMFFHGNQNFLKSTQIRLGVRYNRIQFESFKIVTPEGGGVYQ
jgi:hypothetical protein